jgi:hypothetical protein
MKAIAMKPDPVTARQRKRAVVTAIVLAAVAVAIYAFVMYKYLSH